MDITTLTAENEQRKAALVTTYDPVTGAGCAGDRVLCGNVWLPKALLAECPDYGSLSELEQRRRRVYHDFEYWCATCATIRDKLTGRPERFRLNAPQRRVAAEMERQRQAHLPIRLILLKARQWGGSTLVLMYMAWMQMVRHKGWNSLICGQKKQSARSIKGMYSLLIRHYPADMVEDGVPMQFRKYEGCSDVQSLTGRDCLVLIGSAVNDDDARGFSVCMAHLTEVAYWPDTPMRSPEDVMRSVNGTVGRIEDSLIVLESTANGMGQFFHTEWLRASAGKSDKTPIFVPWHEIEIYRSPVRDAAQLWSEMDAYERGLWDDGLTLEMIQWYHDKRGEAASHVAMMAEFPTTATEAFMCTEHSVFDMAKIERMQQDCLKPEAVGDIEAEPHTVKDAHFVEQANGPFKVWRFPKPGEEYIVAVDIGGRSEKADYSVIAVLCITGMPNRMPEVVAQWRGHLDPDLVGWKAGQISVLYNNSLLVIESNTIETAKNDRENGAYIFGLLQQAGVNLYHRNDSRPGFHTNTRSKHMAINNLIRCVRDNRYVERDNDALNEMATYETTANGGYAAKRGYHDDILMTRAIALMVAMGTPVKREPISDADRRYLFDELTANYPAIPFPGV